MKKLALIALLGVSGLAQAGYMVDAGPVRRDIVAEDPAMLGTAPNAVVGGPVVTPADNNYYYTPYGNRPVANAVAGTSAVAADAVNDAGAVAASVIPF
ncbi:hypothetical protein BH09DEP1_BH09DEP1_1830 [soil metagenome]